MSARESAAGPELVDNAQLDLDGLEAAPVRVRVESVFKASPEAVFARLEDAAAWPKFAPAITGVTWTSPQPFAVGTTRTVEMVGGMVAEEVFLAWEPGRRMSFTFTRSNIPAESFGEDWQISPHGDGGARVVWTMGITPKGYSRFTLPVFAPFLKLGNRWMLRRLRRLVEATPS